jgi:hypothetical protein
MARAVLDQRGELCKVDASAPLAANGLSIKISTVNKIELKQKSA